MPIKKGPISRTWWQVMKYSLGKCAVFGSFGQGSGVGVFLRLKKESSDIASCIEEALESCRFDDVRVYRTLIGNESLVVIGSSRGQRELLYPSMISFAEENDFLLGARIKMQRSLLRFLWNEEGGWILMIIYPLVGAFVVYWSYLLYQTAMPDSPAPMLGRAVTIFMMGLGTSFALAPFVVSYFGRWRLRKAFGKLKNNELSRISELFDGPTPASSA
jgi:hypothetical protein